MLKNLLIAVLIIGCYLPLDAKRGIGLKVELRVAT